MLDSITPLEHKPTFDEVMRRVQVLLPAIRERAAQTEKNRSIPPESAREFLNAGLARVLMPKQFGGWEMGLRAWVEISTEIAKADAAHAWCACMIMHHPHYVAQFPEPAQAEVWRNGPDVAVACTFTPTSKVAFVQGGYRISCEIPYLSGINHCSRVVVGGMVPRQDGPPDWTLFLVPEHAFEIRDTWHTVGMRGTGSNTVIVRDVFVPHEHTLKVTDMRDQRTPGAALHKTPMFNSPWITYATLTFLSPMLGAARGALEDYRRWTAERISLFGAPVAKYTSQQVNIARAAASLDAAEMLMMRSAEVGEMAEPVPEELRARCYRDQARASELIVEAIDTIMRISGAGGFASTSSIQRAWRDVHFASSHVSLNPETSMAAWGRMQFGLERDPQQMMF